MGNWNQWSDESTEQLKALWAEGWSASTIALRLNGAHVTRNAVIGKVHRLALERRRATPVPPYKTLEKYRARARAKYAAMKLCPSLAPINGKARHMKPRLWKARHASPVPAPAYAGEPVSILEVTGCKFAVKSEGRRHLFCNAPCEGPWCSFHETIVWNP